MTNNPLVKAVILSLLFLTLFDLCHSQKKGIISDLDGYTTLRTGPGTQYEAIYEIKEEFDFLNYDHRVLFEKKLIDLLYEEESTNEVQDGDKNKKAG